MESDSDSYFTGEEDIGGVPDDHQDRRVSTEDEEDWLESSGGEDRDGNQNLSDLGAASILINSFTTTKHSTQTVMTDQEDQPTLESGRLSTGGLLPTSESVIDTVPGLLAAPAGQNIIQYNVNQTYNLQRFGDVTVEGARNLNIGGTQNITSKSGASQEEEDKPLTTAQKIRKRTESKLGDWTRGMVKTQSLTKVLDKIHKGSTWVTIKGSPGEGKTTVAYMALEELYNEGRQVFQVISPEEFSEVIMCSSRPVIMLDDIFGDLEFDEAEWMRWRPALKLALDEKEHRSQEQDNNSPTIILIGRDYLLASSSSHMGRLSRFVTDEQYVIEMSSSVQRGQEERMKIWNALIQTRGIEIADDVKNQILQLTNQHGFPHVCRLFAELYQKDKATCPLEFFKTPLEFLNQTIVKFMKNPQQLKLFKEMMKENGKVRIRELRHAPEVLQSAHDLIGPYLKEEDGYFMFDHPSVYDCVAFNLCKLDPLFVIENCNLSFIHQRLRLTGTRQHKEELRRSGLVYISFASYFEDLAKRFASEIQLGNLFHALSHEACSDGRFIQKLMSVVHVPLEVLFKLRDVTTEQSFLFLIASNKSSALLQHIHKAKGNLTKEETETALFGVCTFAAADALSYLVDSCENFDVNVATSDTGMSPLMIAAESQDSQFVHQIMALKPDLKAKDHEHKTVFHHLCGNGHVSLVKTFIRKGTDINIRDKYGESPLWYASARNQGEVVKLLLKSGAKINMQSMDAHFSPLHIAIRRRSRQCMDILLNAGADVNIMTRYGQTSLRLAWEDLSDDYFDPLLKAGADINQRSIDGNTFLHGQTKTSTEFLLNASADVNVQNYDGDTPLHRAAHDNTHDTVVVLLNGGADINVRNKDGDTPLHKAAWHFSPESLKLLLEAGADKDVKDKDGNTSLHKATKRGAVNCLELLLEAGASVNIQNEDGVTVLHTAAEVWSEDYIDNRLKVNINADVNEQSRVNSPLRKAAARKYRNFGWTRWSFDLYVTKDKPELSICQNVIKHGANINAQDTNGNTPLHVLCRVDSNIKEYIDFYTETDFVVEEDHKDLVTLFVESGADVNIKNKKGEPALSDWCRRLLEM